MKQGRKNYSKNQPLSKKQTKEVNKLIAKQGEDKYFDVRYPYTNQSYNTALTNPAGLTASISQGVSVNQRIGDKIRIKSLDLRLSTYHNTANATTDAENNYRIIIFKYNEPTNLHSPAYADLLMYPSLTGFLNYGIDSPYVWHNVNTAHKYSILYDKNFTMAAGAPTKHHHIKINKYLGNLSFETGALQGTGHLYLMVTNDEGIGIAPCPVIGFISRVVYEDM